MNLFKNVYETVQDFGTRKYSPLSEKDLYNSLNALLKEWASGPVDASKEKQTDEFGYAKGYAKDYAPVEPRMFCTNCGQKFVPVASSSPEAIVKNAGYFVPGNTMTKENDADKGECIGTAGLNETTNSLAVELWPDELDQASKGIGLFHEIYMSTLINSKTKKALLKELVTGIYSNLNEVVYKETT